MADIIVPVCGGTAKVWVDGGNDYICVKGENAFISGTTPYSNAAAGVYTGGASPPSSFPGVGGTAPTIIETTVNSDGTFNFAVAATFLPGAAGALHSPYPSDTLAVWFQDSSGVWTDTPLTCTFSGKDASQTDCPGFGGEPLADDDDECKDQLVVELPASRNAARVVKIDGVGYICVRGGNAFDDFGDSDKAIAAKIYRPGAQIPLTPPLADLDLRITRIFYGDNEFDFSTSDMLVPGALATKGRPWPCNKLVLWPLYDDNTWGEPKQILFYGRRSKHTDCYYLTQAQAPAAEPPCKCKGEGKQASPAEADDDEKDDELR